jgi:plasmid stabilization system protein ParE
MRLPVVLSIEAEADLDQAAQWYEQRSSGLGTDLLTKVRETFARIMDNPELYPEVHHRIRRAPIRRFPYGVFYRQMAGRLEVIGIFHDRRDSSVWQSRA